MLTDADRAIAGEALAADTQVASIFTTFQLVVLVTVAEILPVPE